MSKDRKVILVAQCLINPYCRVHLLGQNFPFTEEFVNYLLKERIGIVQYPCPETTAMGLMRNPQGRQQYDNTFFREHCKKLLKIPMLMVKEFIKNNYKLLCFVGLENSPTCGIHWGKHKVNRYNTESPNPAEDVSPSDPVLMGIMAEILADELLKEKIECPFLEFPAKAGPEDKEREKFWSDLKTLIHPR